MAEVTWKTGFVALFVSVSVTTGINLFWMHANLSGFIEGLEVCRAWKSRSALSDRGDGRG